MPDRALTLVATADGALELAGAPVAAAATVRLRVEGGAGTPAPRRPSAAWPATGWRAADGDRTYTADLQPATSFAAAPPLIATLRWSPAGRGALRLHVRLTHAGDGPPVVLRRATVALEGCGRWWDGRPPVALRVAYCGAHSRSPTSRSYARPLRGRMEETSWWVGALSGPDGPGCVLGGAELRRFVTQVRATRDGLAARQHLEWWTLAPGESVDLDALWLAVTAGAPLGALEEYADALARTHDAVVDAPPSGWGSWGHWLERIDAGLVRETVRGLDGSPRLRRAVRLVQIDDGWSELLESHRVSASWRPNRRFPAGIAPLAAEIRASGRECGLWLLPFAVNAGSPLAAHHPEWLVRDGAGEPLRVGGGESYCLDPTHPAAAAWLADLLARVRDWGVRYVKLDFLRALLAPDPALPEDDFDTPRRYANAATRLEAYRAGLAVVREALGPDAFVVACSAPAAAGVGYVTAHRVGPDIEPRWVGRIAGVRDAAHALAANWFWHGRTWTNDPDYLIPCESEALTRFWATMVAMSGGSVVLSADLTALPAWAEEMLAFVAPPIGRAARPLDLFANAPDPRLWHLPLARGGRAWHLAGVVNWREHGVEERVALTALGLAGPVHVWDVWRRTHRVADGEHVVPLLPQDATILSLRPVAAHPQVVGTDVHVAQGWLELAEEGWDGAAATLTLRVAPESPRPGRAWVWVPRGLRLADDVVRATDDAEHEAADASGRLACVPLSPGATAALRFLPTTD